MVGERVDDAPPPTDPPPPVLDGDVEEDVEDDEEFFSLFELSEDSVMILYVHFTFYTVTAMLCYFQFRHEIFLLLLFCHFISPTAFFLFI